MRVVATLAVAAACAVAQAASQDRPQPVPRFRAGVDLVVLDVSVLDRTRLPVRGLAANDFTILEDGLLHAVSHFTAIDLLDTERAEGTASWLREVAPDVQSNDDVIAERPVYVIVLDDSTPMPIADVPAARRLARQVVEGLGPDALVSVVFPFNQGAGQEFTHDRARLFAAIDRFNGSLDQVSGRGGKVVPFDRFDEAAATLYQLTVAKLRDVAENLTLLPQRRKAVVFVSAGLPLDIGLAAPALAGSLDSSTLAASDITQRLMHELRRTVDAAHRANVNIYGLDPGGLRAPVVVRNWLTGSSRLEGNPGLLNREFLQAVSASTGGFALTNTNEIGTGITRILRENSSYYLLGYVSSNTRAEGKHRRVEVSVNRPGVTVRTRSGYFAPRSRAPEPVVEQAGTTPAIEKAIVGPVPQPGISLRAAAAPFAVPGTRTAALAIVLGVGQPADEPGSEPLQVLVRAYDDKGRNVASDRLVGQVERPVASGDVRYEVHSRLDVEPGRYHLRLAAESARQARSGSVYCDVDVPDFRNAPLSLSGVVIARRPGLTAGPTNRIATLVPVMPTADRVFTSAEGAAAFLRVYQGGDGPLGPVRLTTTIRNAHDIVVLREHETLKVDRFSNGRSVDVLFELPLATLARGPHLLSFEAAVGKRVARRQLRLEIR